MDNQEIGYLYVAAGDKHIEEAIVSAESLRRLNDSVNITLIADRNVENSPFDQIIIRPATIRGAPDGWLYKVRHMYDDTPYERTLFLDTDTYFFEDCQDLFETLDFFDMALSLAPADPMKPKSPKTNRRLVACQSYNTGVILFKKSANNDRFFRKWREMYEEKVASQNLDEWDGTLKKWEGDQTVFLQAWLESDSKICTLSFAWNARTPFFFIFTEPIKIIHGRPKDFEAINYEMNQKVDERASRNRFWMPHQRLTMLLDKRTGNILGDPSPYLDD
ncbi:MAG: putative nucleotide-diphospho-sugar transferase [Chloroflexota bacterium]